MPTPTVTAFTAKAHLKNGQDGLNKTDQSTSPANITMRIVLSSPPVARERPSGRKATATTPP
jgi:hypothetical protein